MTLDDIAAELHEVVRDLEPGCVAGPDALRLVRVASEITKLGSTATARYAQRCVETGVWAKDRASRVPAVTPAEWLADVADAPIHTARDALAVAAALPDCPAAEEALRAGTLSLPVAREVTAAAAAGGASAERRVLKTATRAGLRGAKVEAQRVLATASDARERAERVHRERRRHRWITRDGKWNLHLEGPRHSVLTTLVEEGQDVRTFARPGRNVVTKLAQLLEARDATCIVTGCGRAARLEGDHGQAVADGGDSDADNLRGLCRRHHRLKSQGWKLVHHSDGTRTLEPPDDGHPPPGSRPRDAERSVTRPSTTTHTLTPAGGRRAAAA